MGVPLHFSTIVGVPELVIPELQVEVEAVAVIENWEPAP